MDRYTERERVRFCAVFNVLYTLVSLLVGKLLREASQVVLVHFRCYG